jgi:hypothetical protein
MSGAERVWYERLCRRLGCNPVCGPLVDADGRKVVHELLHAVAEGASMDSDRVQRLLEELLAAQVRVEDEHAVELSLPSRPR